MSKRSTNQPAGKQGVAVGWMALLVFGSGAAALIYQLLWTTQLGLLFGATSQAAAVTFAGFFAGLGAGSWWWGRRSAASLEPLRLYARLEWGIAATALVYFALLVVFRAVYPPMYAAFAGTGWLLVVKFLLALVLVFPPAFCMGGTLPVVGQIVVRKPDSFGQTAAVFYGLNTLGAALGVGAAAFWLIPGLGFRGTYAVAVILSAVIGAVAWILGAGPSAPQQAREASVGEGAAVSRWNQAAFLTMCFVSGFVVLGLEVVWTRVFAQVHENSVYAFATILIVVLVGLAIGSGISALMARFSRNPLVAMGILAAIGGAFLVACPHLILHVTNGLEPYQTIESWGESIGRLVKLGIGGIGYTVVALGTVFPFLMKWGERQMRMPGAMLGRMLAVNTLGAIAGSLVAGFVFLPVFGMWKSMQVLALVYLGAGLLLPVGWRGGALAARIAMLVAAGLLLGPANPERFPVVGFVAGKTPPKVLETREGSDATVAVLERADGHLLIQVNGSYSLGSTGNYLEQANQSRIPLHLFPETESICFIGVGTGMSAGAALDVRFPKVKRVVSCELSPEVLEAAEKWIPPQLTEGLFEDERSTILAEDGRQFLMATRERFDMINSDLFLPYQRGAGSLYSLDHYRQVAERLEPGGVFVQWLPLYQLTEWEFGVIVRTMNEVFPDVTMWRNNFFPGAEKVALVGRKQPGAVTIPPGGKRELMLQAVADLPWQQTNPDIVGVSPSSMPFRYAGNLTQARGLFAGYPVNTDDSPVIEYETPKTFREVARKDKVIWCVGPKLVKWIDRILAEAPLEEDPTWQGHPEESLHLARAGTAFHRAMVAKALDDPKVAEDAWRIFLDEWRLGAR